MSGEAPLRMQGWQLIADLYSDIAAELRVRDLYMHLGNMVQDSVPGT